MEDYYNILGVERDAGADEIKRAYRKLAMKYHPDKARGDKDAEQKFKKINQAYSVLGDTEKRVAYDRFGEAGASGAHGGGRAGGPDLNDIFNQFGDIFGGSFGDGFREERTQNNLAYRISVNFEDAYLGAEKKLDISITKPCVSCKGTGAKDGTAFENCQRCKGRGVLRIQRGVFSMQQHCPDCKGKGKRIQESCRVCHGGGSVQERRSISVNIPAGIHDGDTIRLSGQGHVQGRNAGDLYIEVRVKSHPFFQYEDRALICETPVNIIDAALGSKVVLPMPDGKVVLHIPSGTQSGDVLKLRGKGMPNPKFPGGKRGDLFCRIRVETPVNLSSSQKKLLQELNESLAEDAKKHTPQQSIWAERLKKLFR